MGPLRDPLASFELGDSVVGSAQMIAQADVAMRPHAEDLGERQKKGPGRTMRRA
jgi:hypothetical protein